MIIITLGPLILLPLICLFQNSTTYLIFPFMIWGGIILVIIHYCYMIYILYIPDHLLPYQLMNYNIEIWSNCGKIIWIIIFIIDYTCPNVYTNDALFHLATLMALYSPYINSYIIKSPGPWLSKIRFYTSTILIDSWPNFVYYNYSGYITIFNDGYGVLI